MASVSISCPSCSATDGVVRNGKSTAGHQRYLCSHCRKTWQLQFTYTASQPGTHQKIIDMAMNGVGCRATARIMGVGLNTIFRHLLNLQSKCNKKRSTHQLEYNFVSTQKPFPNDEYFLPTSYNKRARKDNDFTRTGQKTSRNCQSTGT